MSDQIIPLSNSPNQLFAIPLNVDGSVLTLNFTMRYNEIADYWVMTIRDSQGNLILDSVPLVTGLFPAANILGQFAYLEIGSAFVINISQVKSPNFPNNTDLGTDFQLDWSDTPAA